VCFDSSQSFLSALIFQDDEWTTKLVERQGWSHTHDRDINAAFFSMPTRGGRAWTIEDHATIMLT
jgi:hypothetical protein